MISAPLCGTKKGTQNQQARGHVQRARGWQRRPVLRVELLLDIGAQDREVLVELADGRVVNGRLELASLHVAQNGAHESLDVLAVLLLARSKTAEAAE